MNPRAANSIAAALPSCRVLLLFGGIVLISESVALATTLLVAGGLSFAATLVLATKMYRASGRRPASDHVRGEAKRRRQTGATPSKRDRRVGSRSASVGVGAVARGHTALRAEEAI